MNTKKSSSSQEAAATVTRRVLLFGEQADSLAPMLRKHPALTLVQHDPDVVVCYGGDGTLLAAELQFPGVPKAPILNSRRGHRCIPNAPEEVVAALAQDALLHNAYTKLECALFSSASRKKADFKLTCLNEINVHMGRINSAVRFRLWVNNTPFENGVEIVSDGFVACTAFGSTAYFKAITKGFFLQGIGIAFKATTYPVNHLVLPEASKIRFEITRGPATLAFDNSLEYLTLVQGDTLLVRKHARSAIILTSHPVTKLEEPF